MGRRAGWRLLARSLLKTVESMMEYLRRYWVSSFRYEGGLEWDESEKVDTERGDWTRKLVCLLHLRAAVEAVISYLQRIQSQYEGDPAIENLGEKLYLH